MAELFNQPNLWKDSSNNTPPAQWDGTKYEFLHGDVLTFIGTAAAGDTVSFDAAGTQDGASFSPAAIYVNASPPGGSPTAEVDYGGLPASLTVTLQAGDAVKVMGVGTSFGYTGDVTLTPPAVVAAECTFNCDCDDSADHNRTLADLRSDLMVRLGYAAQKDNPPPGMTDLMNSFLIEAQRILYRRYKVLRTLRFYSWHLQSGTRFYDIEANEESCTKKLDPRMVHWVGVEMDDTWYPLECGIPPELYSGSPTGWPQRYEIRQCIEVWPVPDETDGCLIVKGDFGLEPFAADGDKTTIDDQLVFLLALANAKAHYGKPDASNYVAQMETMMLDLVAGSHNTRRYIPKKPSRFDLIYTAPKPTTPFPS